LLFDLLKSYNQPVRKLKFKIVVNARNRTLVQWKAGCIHTPIFDSLTILITRSAVIKIMYGTPSEYNTKNNELQSQMTRPDL